jgi:hypothetical protein
MAADDFAKLRDALLNARLETRAHLQGDTITRRVAVGPDLLSTVPNLRKLLARRDLNALLAYVASTGSKPLFYVQTIAAGVVDGPPDPQLQLHSDTFHPSLKAWLFLTDVADDDRPLTYVAGSHRLTPARLAWEQARSADIANADRLSQRGSLRVEPDELPGLGLPPPTRFAVPANTLVAVDTYGFHARGDADHPTTRVELWAYSRRSPFLPWTGLDPLSIPGIAERRADWLARLFDRADRLGIARQHWKNVGLRRPGDAQ